MRVSTLPRKRPDVEVGADRASSCAARRGEPVPTLAPAGKRRQRELITRDQGIAWILTGRYRGDAQVAARARSEDPSTNARRHRRCHSSSSSRSSRDEHPDATRLSQRSAAAIAIGRHADELDRGSGGAQRLRDRGCLRHRQGAAPCTKTNDRGRCVGRHRRRELGSRLIRRARSGRDAAIAAGADGSRSNNRRNASG